MNAEHPKTLPMIAIQLDNISSRALQFDMIGNEYRLLGMGSSTTTLHTSGRDVNFGVRLALEELQAVTGKIILDAHKGLIQPVSRDGMGVNRCILTLSVGPPLKIFIVGFSKDATLQHARRLAKYAGQCDLTVSYLDYFSTPQELIDEFIKVLPDIVILATGSGEYTSQQIIQELEPLKLALSLLPDEIQPEILLYADQSRAPTIHQIFGAAIARPPISTSQTNKEINPDNLFLFELDQAILKIRSRQVPGLSDLIKSTRASVWTENAAFLQLIHFLDSMYPTNKGLLGINIDPTEILMTAAFNKEQVFETVAYLGSGNSQASGFDPFLINEIQTWLCIPDITDDAILEYLLNKMIYPGSKPLSVQDQAVEFAVARAMLRNLIKISLEHLPIQIKSLEGYLQNIEAILLSGTSMVADANPGQVCLLILDGLQPLGVTTLMIDPTNLAASFGALAAVTPELVTHGSGPDYLKHLATVISLAGRSSPGTSVLRIRAIFEDGREMSLDVKQGELKSIPLPPGHSAQIHLQPLHRYDVGMGEAGRGGILRVNGSILGVVIDARGRPLKLPVDLLKRNELYQKWLWMLGG